MQTIQGSCLCHQVQFECDDNFSQFHFCHCKQCQKATGSAHVANLFIDPEKLRWIAGEDQIKRFDIPGRSITSAFCSHCGSPVPYVSTSGKIMVVPAGSLEASPTLAVQDHIFWHERADWYEQGIPSKKWNGFPA